jgi:hypothetical protein
MAMDAAISSLLRPSATWLPTFERTPGRPQYLELVAAPGSFASFEAAEAVAFTVLGLGTIGAAFAIVTWRARRRDPTTYRGAAATSASG